MHCSLDLGDEISSSEILVVRSWKGDVGSEVLKVGLWVVIF